MSENQVIPIDLTFKHDIDNVKSSILAAKREMGNAWLAMAIGLLMLKSKMEEIGDRRTNWQTYVGVDSFKEYCNEVIHLSDKTCYQMIDSLQFIETTNPQLLKDYNERSKAVEAPPYSKLSLIAAKAKLIQKKSPDKLDNAIKLAYDSSVSRRDLESKIKEMLTGRPIHKSELHEVQDDRDNKKIRDYINKAKTKLMPSIVNGNLQKVGQWVHGLMDLASGKTSDRSENPGIKRILVAQSVTDKTYATEVIDRARKLDPTIDIVYVGEKTRSNKATFPSSLSAHGKYWYSKESLLLRDRGDSTFIETFPSPGTIVENLGTMLKLGFHCKSICEYCYLQGGSYSWQEIFTNLDRVRDEIRTETVVHTALLTIWSAYSFYKQELTLKVPPDFHKVGNSLRQKFIKQRINKESRAVQYLRENIGALLRKSKLEVDEKKLKRIIKDIPLYYQENKKYGLTLNVGEYTDIIAAEPISNQIKFIFDEIVNKYENIDISIWTKSTNFDEILKHDGQNRITFTIGINTNHIINAYETGTATLDERIDGVNKLQARGGYKIILNLEPIIIYNNCEQDYIKLIHDVMTKVNPDQIAGLNMGTTRFRKDMVGTIRRNHPWSDLLDNMEEFEEYDLEDRRLRYSEEFRINIYKDLIHAFRAYSQAPIVLGAEVPEMWGWIGLDMDAYIKDLVYQFPG